MKQAHGWWFPDHEQHLIAWMASPKNSVTLNGRVAYQGKKQVATLARCRSNGTAVDVGAHIGLWSYNLAHRFEHVHAFEPMAAHRECFARNVNLPNVTLHHCALGAVEGNVGLFSETGSSGNTHVRGEGNIPLKLLDSFNLENVDLIKLDCEGYEEHVLHGAMATIMRFTPTIIVEQKRDMAARFGLEPQGAVAWLKNLGYKVAEEISGDYIMVPS